MSIKNNISDSTLVVKHLLPLPNLSPIQNAHIGDDNFIDDNNCLHKMYLPKHYPVISIDKLIAAIHNV